jgi:hypothetical protein
VVYVSCNVHTQARDVGWFLTQSWAEERVAKQGGKYVLESLRGFDLFPQVCHTSYQVRAGLMIDRTCRISGCTSLDPYIECLDHACISGRDQLAAIIYSVYYHYQATACTEFALGFEETVGLGPGVKLTVPVDDAPGEDEVAGIAVTGEICSTTFSFTTALPLIAPAITPARIRRTKTDRQMVH